jgi:hypothetical protein
MPPIEFVLVALSLKVKWLRDADHSPLTTAEAKKTWIYTSTPPYALCLISYAQGQLYLTLQGRLLSKL